MVLWPKIWFTTDLNLWVWASKSPTNSMNIFEFWQTQSKVWAWATAQLPKPTAINIFDNLPKLNIPSISDTMWQFQWTTLSPKTATQTRSDLTPSLWERLSNINIPILWNTPETRKKIYDAGLQESKLQDLVDTFDRSFINMIMSQKDVIQWPIAQTFIKDKEKAATYFDKYQEKFDRQKDQPRLQEREERREFARSKLKQPWYLANIISQSMWQMAAVIVPSIAATTATWNPLVWAWVMWTMFFWPSATEVYDELLTSKVDPDIAAPVSLVAWVPIAAIDFVSDRLQLSKIPWLWAILKKAKDEAIKQTVKFSTSQIVKKVAKEWLTVNMVESLTEMTQEFMKNAVVKYFDNNRSLLDWLEEAWVFWFIWSSPFAWLWSFGKYSELTQQNQQIWQMQEWKSRIMNELTSQQPSYLPNINTQQQWVQQINNTAWQLQTIDTRIEEIQTRIDQYNTMIESNNNMTPDQLQNVQEMTVYLEWQKVQLEAYKYDLMWQEWPKYQTMDEVQVSPDPITQLSQPYQWPETTTSKLLDDLIGKNTVAKQYIQDFMNRPDVKQAEKNVIKEILDQYEGKKINVPSFAKALEDRLFKLRAEPWYREWETYGDSQKIFNDNPLVRDFNYDEVVYTMPYKENPRSHYSNEDYFGHVRQYDVDRDGTPVRYIIEKQSDLTQAGKWADLSVELNQKWFIEYLQKDITRLEKDIIEKERYIKKLNNNILENRNDQRSMQILEYQDKQLLKMKQELEIAKEKLERSQDLDVFYDEYYQWSDLPKQDRVNNAKQMIQSQEVAHKFKMEIVNKIRDYGIEKFVDWWIDQVVLKSDMWKSWNDETRKQYSDLLNAYIADVTWYDLIYKDYKAERGITEGMQASAYNDVDNMLPSSATARIQAADPDQLTNIKETVSKDFTNWIKSAEDRRNIAMSKAKQRLEFLEWGWYDRMNKDIYDNQAQWHKYILRHEIQRAINDGKKELYLPTWQSIPYYEWWMNANGIDVENASIWDVVTIHGEQYYFLQDTGSRWEIWAVPYNWWSNETIITDTTTLVNEEINNEQEIMRDSIESWEYDSDNAVGINYDGIIEQYGSNYDSTMNIKQFLFSPSVVRLFWDNAYDKFYEIKERLATENNSRYYDVEDAALLELFWSKEEFKDTFIEYMENEIDDNRSNMSDYQLSNRIEDMWAWNTVYIEDGTVVLSQNDMQTFEKDRSDTIDPNDYEFSDPEFQDKVESAWWSSWLGTAKYYEYVLKNEVRDLSKQYWYDRSIERDANGLMHYVIDLEGIAEKWIDKPVPAFKRKAEAKSEPISQEEALSITREYFSADEVWVSFVKKIVTPEWKAAFGQYFDSLITFARDIDPSTPRHEVLHAYLDLFTRPEDKKALFRETRNNQEYKDRLRDRKDSDIMAEEFLADKFDAYVRENQMPKSLKGKIKDFFVNIVESVKKLFGKHNKMRDLYIKIINKDRSYIADRRNFDPKFMEDPIADFLKAMDETAPVYTQEQQKNIDDMSRDEMLEYIAQIENKVKEAEMGAIEASFMASNDAVAVSEDLQLSRYFAKEIYKLSQREQRLHKVGNKKIKDPDKKWAREQAFLKDKEYIIERIWEEYGIDQFEAAEKYAQFEAMPLEKIMENVTPKKKAGRKTRSANVSDVSQNKTWVYARQQAMKKLKEDLWLTDTDMLQYVKVDYTTLSDGKWEWYYERISARLAQVAEKKKALQKMNDTIKQKNLQKEKNLRTALKKDVKKMTTKELDEYTSLLQSFEDADTFLWPRMIQTLENTDIKNVKTVWELAEKFAAEFNMSKEQIMELFRVRAKKKELWLAPDKTMKDWDRLLYYIISDSWLAKSKNPVIKLMVKDFYVSKMEEDAQRFAFENEFRKKLSAARKSRWSKRWNVWDKIAPEDNLVFDYLEAEWDAKQALWDQMTVEEYELANFLADEFRKAKEYMEARDQLRTRYADKYVTHIQRSFLETVKYDGLKNAVKEIVKQENEIDFAYSWDTDQVLWLEKFFKYAMTRSGKITPSKNLNKIALSYFRTYYKKRALDKIIPKIAAYSYVLWDSNTNKFVKQWLNDKKWRRIDGLMQGGWIDNILMWIKAITTAIDLWGNLTINLLSWVWSTGSNINASSTKEFILGHKRAMTKRWVAIMDKYAHVIGRPPQDTWTLWDKSPRDRIQDALFFWMSYTTYMSQRQFFLWQLTDQEWQSWEVSAQRQAEIKLKMLETYPAEDGSQWLAFKTSIWQTFAQYKSWAFPYLERTLQNTMILYEWSKGKWIMKSIKENKQEAKQLLKMMPWSLWISLAVAIMIWWEPDDDDYSLIARLKRKAIEESMSALEALSLETRWSVRSWQFVKDIHDGIVMLIKLERYKRDGKYGKEWDLKWVSHLERKLTPSLIRQFQQIDSWTQSSSDRNSTIKDRQKWPASRTQETKDRGR